jgi:DNA-binding phage protein
LANSKVPNYRDLTGLYLDGMSQEEIIRMYKADAPQMDVRSTKHDTKLKIIHFFKVIEALKKAFIEHPRAQVNRTELLSYVCKKTLISTTSLMRVLNALEEQGWSLQEVTKDNELPNRTYEKRQSVQYNS